VIIYFHGFGSSGNSPKVATLKAKFGEENVIAPNLPNNPTDVTKLVVQLVQDWFAHKQTNDKLVFVGTSLGAFYAGYFANVYDAPGVLVNPSVNPLESLKDRVGKNVNHATKEEFWLTLNDLEKLQAMRKYMSEVYDGSLIHLFVAKDDEVIPYYDMLNWYQYTASTTVKETGGHRFAEHWLEVVDKLAELV